MLFKILFFPFRLLGLFLTPWYLRWLFRLPWIIYLLGAAALGYFAWQELNVAKQLERQAAQALLTGAPAPQPLSTWTPQDASDLGEVLVDGVYFRSMPVGEFTVGVRTYAFVYLGDDLGKTIKAVLVVPSHDLSRLQAQLEQAATRNDGAVRINGLLSDSDAWAANVDTGMVLHGLPREGQVIIIEPFLTDRDTALVRAFKDQFDLVAVLALFAGLLTLMALYRLWRSRSTKRPAGSPAVPKPRRAASAQPAAMPAASPWGGPSTPAATPPSAPRASAPQTKAPPAPTSQADHHQPLPAQFKSVFPGGGSGFRFKTTDEIILETFGTVTRTDRSTQ